MDFGDFLIKLQQEEGVSPASSLASPWSDSRAADIIEKWSQGIYKAGLIGKRCNPKPRLWAKRTNQSRGNLVASFIAAQLGQSIPDYQISALRQEQGYPDLQLSHLTEGFSCALELKATSRWDDKDNNRRVLLSSTRKLRASIGHSLLPAQPCHLLATVNYENASSAIESIRLDFIEPSTMVAVRLEASTSHRMLIEGAQRSTLIS